MTVLFGWLHLYGLLIGLGVAAGILAVERVGRWFKQDSAWLDSSLLWIVVGAIIGGRLYHLATDWQLYLNASFLDLIAVWKGGIGFIGAVIGGFLGLYLWQRFSRFPKKLPLFTYLDLLSFGIPIAQIIGRLGNWANGELYGQPTTLPWGIIVNGQRYHPLFAYEGVLNFILFLILLVSARRRVFTLGKGQYASLYLFGYTLIRFWLEYLRIETARWEGPLGVFSIAQWVSLTGMVAAVCIFWLRRHYPEKPWDLSLD